MSKIYGYARASTPTQDTKTQLSKIKEQFPDADVREENYTGTTQDRPVWRKLKKELTDGCTVVFVEVSRMGRTGQEAFEEYMELYNRGIRLVFLRDHGCDTDSYSAAMKQSIEVNVNSGVEYVDNFITSIINALNTFMQTKVKRDILQAFEEAKHEVDRLHVRTSDAMRERGACNVYKTDENTGEKTLVKYGTIAQSKLGKHVETRKAKESKELILKHSKSFGGSLNDSECQKLCGCSRNSYYKWKKELKELSDSRKHKES